MNKMIEPQFQLQPASQISVSRTDHESNSIAQQLMQENAACHRHIQRVEHPFRIHLYIRVYSFVHTCTYACTYVCVCARAHVRVSAHVRACTSLSTSPSPSPSTSIRMYRDEHGLSPDLFPKERVLWYMHMHKYVALQ